MDACLFANSVHVIVVFWFTDAARAVRRHALDATCIVTMSDYLLDTFISSLIGRDLHEDVGTLPLKRPRPDPQPSAAPPPHLVNVLREIGFLTLSGRVYHR